MRDQSLVEWLLHKIFQGERGLLLSLDAQEMLHLINQEDYLLVVFLVFNVFF